MAENRDLRGRVVVVTGSARGIGAATAEAFRDAGARVVLADVDEEALAAAEARVRPAMAVRLDVTERSSFEAAFDAVEAQLGPVDVLVNNAGIMPLARVTEISDALIDRTIDIDLRGVIIGTRVALARMLPRRAGHIINIASVAGEVIGDGGSAYCAAKFGVIGFTDAARFELEDSGVDLSLVLPSLVRTELLSGVKTLKGFPIADPPAIAATIVALARRPRRRVYAPRSSAVATRAFRILPQALGEWMMRKMGSDTIVDDLDLGARRAYHERIGADPDAAALGRAGEERAS